MEAKKSRKKLGLLILSAVLVIVLAVTGTLMLFTAQTDTATNVVTLDEAQVVLEEKDGTVVPDYKVVNTSVPTGHADYFEGIAYPDKAKHGDTFAKLPRIKNTGDVAVYTFVKLEFIVKEYNGYTGNWEQINFNDSAQKAKYFGDSNYNLNDAADKFRSFLPAFGTTGASTDWYGLPGSFDSNGTLSGGYFYTTTINVPGLKLAAVAPNGGASSDVFKSITIPADLYPALGNVKFELKLTGYAVQSEGNPYNNRPTASQDTTDFKVAFEDLRTEIGMW